MALSQSGPYIIKMGAANQSFGGPVIVSQLWYTGNTSAGGRAVVKSGTATVIWEVYNSGSKDYNSIQFDPPRKFSNLILTTLSNAGAVYGEIG